MQQSWILCIWKDIKRFWQRRTDSRWRRSSKQYILCNNINVLYLIGSQSSLPLSTRKTLTSARSDFSSEADTALDNFFWTRTMHCISGCSSWRPIDVGSLWTCVVVFLQMFLVQCLVHCVALWLTQCNVQLYWNMKAVNICKVLLRCMFSGNFDCIGLFVAHILWVAPSWSCCSDLEWLLWLLWRRLAENLKKWVLSDLL